MRLHEPLRQLYSADPNDRRPYTPSPLVCTHGRSVVTCPDAYTEEERAEVLARNTHTG